MKTLSPTLGYVDFNKPQIYQFHSQTKGYLNLEFDNCLGNTTALYAVKKQNEKDSELKWKTLIDKNMQLSKVAINPNNVVYYKFEKKEDQHMTTQEHNKEDKDKSTQLNGPNIFEFMSFISKNFNSDAYEGLILTGEDLDNDVAQVRVVAGDDVPFVRFQQVKFKNLDEIKKDNHIQVTYYLHLSESPEVLRYVSHCETFMEDRLNQSFNNPKYFTYHTI